MEYANVVWGPDYIGDFQMLEKVQRRATKCIPELFNLEYDDCLSALNLPSLSYQRHRADMLMVYNILAMSVYSLKCFFTDNCLVQQEDTVSNCSSRMHKFNFFFF